MLLAWYGTDCKITFSCMPVTSPIRSQFSLDFDVTLHHGLEPKISKQIRWGQNPTTPSPGLPPFFHLSNAFSMGTRMVQLPATAAIEYVAACCRTRTRTKTKTKTKIGTITKTVRGRYARSPQVQYVYAPSGLSVPSNVA